MKIGRRLQPSQTERGVATVEFAVVLPLLLMIIFGILEFGRIMMVVHMLNAAAREGARVAALPGTDNDMVLAKINQELAGAGLTVDSYVFTPSDISDAERNDPVTVNLRINYSSIAWVPGFFPGLDGMVLEGLVVMRKEGFG
jgi:Flp pilus assembly protein TadG